MVATQAPFFRHINDKYSRISTLVYCICYNDVPSYIHLNLRPRTRQTIPTRQVGLRMVSVGV